MPESQTIMGIDQSLRCTAWFIIKGEETFCGTIETKLDRSEEMYADLFRRCNHIAQELREVYDKHEVDLISIEGLSFGSNGSATRNLAVLMGVILSGYPEHVWRVTSPSTIKMFATGSGRASKEDVLEVIKYRDRALYDAFSGITKNHGRYDLSDAYWLCHYLKENIS